MVVHVARNCYSGYIIKVVKKIICTEYLLLEVDAGEAVGAGGEGDLENYPPNSNWVLLVIWILQGRGVPWLTQATH